MSELLELKSKVYCGYFEIHIQEFLKIISNLKFKIIKHREFTLNS